MKRSVVPPHHGSELLSDQALTVERLGQPRFRSPMELGDSYVDERDRVVAFSDWSDLEPYVEQAKALPAFEPAGPREHLFFDPATVRCGIVTCGGLCPGLNDVVRAIVLMLRTVYQVERVLGFRFGYAGLSRSAAHEAVPLTPEVVDNIHEQGGTLLGSSRGSPGVEEMVSTLIETQINVLFAIGGDGTMRGALALCDEIRRRDLPIAVIGVPKTIDNDLHWVERSFGFATAVEEARRAIMAAHVEARGAPNGIGLVKLMGRHSGFIAAHASLANSDVNFCLVPEVPFALHGPGGFLPELKKRLLASQHAVVVVAEGAGQELLQAEPAPGRDASGNIKLKDIGLFLKQEILDYFTQSGLSISIKYIDPSYLVRSLPANSLDSEFCLMFGQYAVHAAMAGRTRMMVSYWHQRFMHVPLEMVVKGRKRLDPEGELWHSVLWATEQPARMGV